MPSTPPGPHSPPNCVRKGRSYISTHQMKADRTVAQQGSLTHEHYIQQFSPILLIRPFGLFSCPKKRLHPPPPARPQAVPLLTILPPKIYSRAYPCFETERSESKYTWRGVLLSIPSVRQHTPLSWCDYSSPLSPLHILYVPERGA